MDVSVEDKSEDMEAFYSGKNLPLLDVDTQPYKLCILCNLFAPHLDNRCTFCRDEKRWSECCKRRHTGPHNNFGQCILCNAEKTGLQMSLPRFKDFRAYCKECKIVTRHGGDLKCIKCREDIYRRSDKSLHFNCQGCYQQSPYSEFCTLCHPELMPFPQRPIGYRYAVTYKLTGDDIQNPDYKQRPGYGPSGYDKDAVPAVGDWVEPPNNKPSYFTKSEVLSDSSAFYAMQIDDTVGPRYLRCCPKGDYELIPSIPTSGQQLKRCESCKADKTYFNCPSPYSRKLINAINFMFITTDD
jgi:hypothetical protein